MPGEDHRSEGSRRRWTRAAQFAIAMVVIGVLGGVTAAGGKASEIGSPLLPPTTPPITTTSVGAARTPPVASKPSAELLIVGDSVTFLSGGFIGEQFGMPNVDVIAIPGYRSGQLLPLLAASMAERGDAAVAGEEAAFLVGYNDVLKDAPDRTPLRAMVLDASRFRCAVWLTLPTRPGGRPAPNARFPVGLAERWNRDVVAVVSSYPTVHLVRDWERAVDADASLLQDDGVHPTISGRARLALLYKQALARDCG